MWALSRTRARQCEWVTSCAGDADALNERDVAALLDTIDSADESASSRDEGDGAEDASTDVDDVDDDDDDALRYEAMVDDYLDRSYQTYLERHHARDANQLERTKRKRLAADGALPLSAQSLDLGSLCFTLLTACRLCAPCSARVCVSAFSS